MKKTNHVINENEKKGKAINGKTKQEIYLVRPETKIVEIYDANAGEPVYVQYLHDECSIKGADMQARISSDIALADQVAMEAEEKLQKQSMRISKHPLKIDSNMIVMDSLEIGILKIFEPCNKQVSVNYSSDGCVIGGAELIAEIKTNILSEERAVLVTEIYCKDGCEELAKAMIDQVEFFAEYYEDYDKIRMKDSVHRKWVSCKA